MVILYFRSKACKKELRQKIMASSNQSSADTTTLISSANNSSSLAVPISAANVNPPNIGGQVGGMGVGAQGGAGNGGNLQQPPPPI